MKNSISLHGIVADFSPPNLQRLQMRIQSTLKYQMCTV